jgi:two-component system sensor histidine kinase ArlS
MRRIEPYRELNTPIVIEQQPYTYKARINLVETEDLMKSIALLFIAVIIILLAGLFYLRKTIR